MSDFSEDEMKYSFEKAVWSDLGFCLRAIDEGRAFQREQGFVQWADNYPDRSLIEEDIRTGIGHILCLNGEKAGYVAIDFAGEPVYRDIKGKWNTGEPYVVIRRITFTRAFAGRGLSGIMFSAIDDFCRGNGVKNIRLNTGKENGRMQHSLITAGYSFCGTVVYRGIERLAYDKILS